MFDYFNGFWNWAAEHPAQHNPTSTAIYFYIVSIANQLGWKPEFSLSSTQVMNGCGIANYKTYKKHLDILIENGLIKIVRESKNQYMANIFALVNFTEALPKQDQSSTEALLKQAQSTSHIHKTIKTIKTYKTIEEISKEHFNHEKINALFIQYLSERIARKKYPTENAIQLLKKRMRNIYKTPDEAIEGLELAIANGWAGLFEIDKKKNSKQQEPTVTRASMGLKMQ
jgi:SOS-response transcriptional repressor LexA